MTLSFRHGLLTFALALLVLLTAGLGTLSFFLAVREGLLARVAGGSLLQLLLATAPLPAGATVGLFLLRRAYRKSSSPEIFFFALFVAALGFEGLLLFQGWVTLAPLPSFVTSVMTRILWAFRVFALLALVWASLFNFEFSYRKYGNLVGLAALVGLLVAWGLPLRTSTARNQLLYAVGDAPALVLVTSLLALAVLANFVLGARQPSSGDRARFQAAAAACFLAAWTAAIVAGPWAAWLAAPGVFLSAWKAERSGVL